MIFLPKNYNYTS